MVTDSFLHGNCERLLDTGPGDDPQSQCDVLQWNGNARACRAASGPRRSTEEPVPTNVKQKTKSQEEFYFDAVSVVLFGPLARKVHIDKQAFPGLTFRFRRLSAEDLADDPAFLAERLEEFRGSTGIGYAILGPSGRSFRARRGKRCLKAEIDDDQLERKALATLVAALPAWRILFVIPGRSGFFDDAPPKLCWGQSSLWALQTVTFKTPVDNDMIGRVRLHRRGFLPAPHRERVLRRDLREGDLGGPVVFGELAAEAVDLDLRSTVPSDPVLHHHGRVHRHFCRGGPVHDPRAERARQDDECKAGLRDSAGLVEVWPELWETMGSVADLLLQLRRAHPELRGLRRALGPAPELEPPNADVIALVRAKVAELVGLSAEEAEQHHPASPWRHGLVGRIQDLCGDPDMPLRSWLRDGAPMGLRVPIVPGGLFPLVEPDPVMTPDQVFDHVRLGNHPSFLAPGPDGQPTGLQTITDHLNAGFGFLFADLGAAERYLGSSVTPAPLGCIVKVKEDGSTKTRVIMDLRRNCVNSATRVPERQVLPTVMHHAMDLLKLTGPMTEDDDIYTMVLDFCDAFMGIPLAAEEQAFNACYLEGGIERARGPAFPGEVRRGSVVVWRVLGFGGKPNPVVYSRAASFAARTGQALLRTSAACRHGTRKCAPGRLQLYVDDPVLSLVGAQADVDAGIDILLVWWLCLGPPLAWRKGSFGTGPHRWIGAIFDVKPAAGATEAIRALIGAATHYVVVMVPPEFIETLAGDLEFFLDGARQVTDEIVQRAIGRCGRLAYIVPAVRPFVSALWGALSASDAAARRGRPEAPPGSHPTSRFSTAARWILTLLRPPVGEQVWLPLENVITTHLADINLQTAARVEVDASPWGAGAVIFVDGRPAEYWSISWLPADAECLGVSIGSPAGQTTWELLAIFLVLVVWGTSHRTQGLAILGDNTASLESALHLSGRGSLSRIAREISWRRARAGWRYAVGHLPTERNLLADALSRLHAPGADAHDLPYELRDVSERRPPCVEKLWAL